MQSLQQGLGWLIEQSIPTNDSHVESTSASPVPEEECLLGPSSENLLEADAIPASSSAPFSSPAITLVLFQCGVFFHFCAF